MNCFFLKFSAVNSSRFHHQWLPDSIVYEKDAFKEKVMKKLKKLGYSFKDNNNKKRIIGMVSAIMIDNKNKIIYGIFDKRGTGKAVGY